MLRTIEASETGIVWGAQYCVRKAMSISVQLLSWFFQLVTVGWGHIGMAMALEFRIARREMFWSCYVYWIPLGCWSFWEMQANLIFLMMISDCSDSWNVLCRRSLDCLQGLSTGRASILVLLVNSSKIHITRLNHNRLAFHGRICTLQP